MRKPKTKEKHHYIIMWSSISGDGWRVKHRIIRDEKGPDCIWHIETRLTDNPAELFGVYEVNDRKFFGKLWIAQKVEYKRATTWKAIGEAVKRLEVKERLG